jgi:putative flippase GtrA
LIRQEFFRFVVGGAINTAVTFALFEVLLWTGVPHLIAYSIAYVTGIVFSYWLNARYVFRKARTWKSAAAFPMVSLAQYVIGAALMWLLVDHLGVAPTWALVIVLAVNTPLSYLFSRLVFRHSGG